MMELILEEGLLQFDGQVLELFSDTGKNFRYHVRFINQLELQEGRKGITLVNLQYGKKGASGFSGWIVPQENVGLAAAFIQAVNEAKAAFSNGN